jgi:ATP-dependent RNA helicase DDX24/MAK5
MGEGAVGSSLSLLAPGEDKFQSNIVKTLQVKFESIAMDGRLLSGAQERVNLATKVATVDDAERKTQRDNHWFQEQAEAAGLEMDDDLLDDGLAGGDKRDRARWNEAKSARERLRFLLSQPMKTQRFGKFLSTNSAVTQAIVPEPVALASLPVIRDGKKKRKRHNASQN